MTWSASKQDLVRSLGARPVLADALDRRFHYKRRQPRWDHSRDPRANRRDLEAIASAVGGFRRIPR
jgi:hypothetical protein